MDFLGSLAKIVRENSTKIGTTEKYVSFAEICLREKFRFSFINVVCPRETMKYSRLWLLKKRNKIWGETTLPFFSMFISFIRKEEICLHTNWWMSDKMWNSFVDFVVAAKLLNVCICVPLHSCACLDGENFQKFSLHISCFAFAHTLFVCAFFGLHSNEKH